MTYLTIFFKFLEFFYLFMVIKNIAKYVMSFMFLKNHDTFYDRFIDKFLIFQVKQHFPQDK